MAKLINKSKMTGGSFLEVCNHLCMCCCQEQIEVEHFLVGLIVSLRTISNDMPVTTCPQCKGKTHIRKFSLVVHVNPTHTIIVDKMCRYCDTCDLLIVHRDQLQEQLANNLLMINPEAIGNDYLVIGTLQREEWNRLKHDGWSFGQIVEHLHDFQEVVTFERVPQ